VGEINLPFAHERIQILEPDAKYFHAMLSCAPKIIPRPWRVCTFLISSPPLAGVYFSYFFPSPGGRGLRGGG
jgi:hypothetical protein